MNLSGGMAREWKHEMKPPEKYKRKLNRPRYNTQIASLIAIDAWWDGYRFERSGCYTYLYRTPEGNWFTVTETIGGDERECLIPITQDEAIELYDQYLKYHKVIYSEAFPTGEKKHEWKSPGSFKKKYFNRPRYNTQFASLSATNEYWDGYSSMAGGGCVTLLLREPGGEYYTATINHWQPEREGIEPITQDEAIEFYESPLCEHEVEYSEAFADVEIEDA